MMSGGGASASAEGGGGEEAPLSAATSPPPCLEWKFSQVFGERAAGEDVQEVDIISAIEFDKTGEHLATGDRGGRVVLFERTDGKDLHSRKDLERMDYPVTRHPEFRYKTEFQSHEPEFDYLKSLEIEEKINKIRWCPPANGALFLLSTNDKTVKFWKVQEKKIKKLLDINVESSGHRENGSTIAESSVISPKSHSICSSNGGLSEQTSSYPCNDFVFPPGGIPSLRLPMVTSTETSLVARCRRVYAHAHDYHINSISNNSDGETFISADDLRVNLWNLEISDQSFNIVDVKPANMEDLTEVITSAEFHPSHCNMLAYSSSKGTIRLIDMRQSALCDNHAKLFEEQEAPGTRSFFTEIIASISDIKFGKDGRYILCRDYMTLKVYAFSFSVLWMCVFTDNCWGCDNIYPFLQIFFFNTRSRMQGHITNILCFRIEQLPSQYLGVPLFKEAGRSSLWVWESLLDRCKSRVESCKCK